MSMRTVAVVALACAGWCAAAAQTATGTTWTTRVTKVSRGGPGTSAVSTTPEMAMVTVTAAGRTRSDIVEGTMFARVGISSGDYMLADSAGSIIVSPATKSFYAQRRNVAQHVDSILSAGPNKVTWKSISSSVDTLGPGETIEGRPTRRFRTRHTDVVTFDIGELAAQLREIPGLPDLGAPDTVTTTADYWYSDLPVTGFTSFTSIEPPATPSRTGLSGALQSRLDQRAALPSGYMVLRSIVAIVIRRDGEPVTSETQTDVSGYRQVAVDLGTLAIPDDFVEKPRAEMAGLTAPSQDGGARWKASAWAAKLKAMPPRP